jgi:hypothetical protein
LKVAAINNAASQKLKELSTEKRVAVDDIFSDFERSNKDLEARKDAAELEQIGFLMALQDKSYLAEIDRIGRERGLTDEIQFREEMQRLTMGNALSDQASKLGFQSMYNADQRMFERQLASIDIAGALSMAEAAIRDSNNQAMVQGVVETGKAGLDYWAKSEDKKAPA